MCFARKYLVKVLLWSACSIGVGLNNNSYAASIDENIDTLRLDNLLPDSIRSTLKNAEGRDKIEVLHSIVISLWLNYPDSAVAYSNEALRLSRELNDSASLSKSYRLLGGVFYYKGDYDASLNHGHKSLEIALTINDSSLINNSLNNIGLVYFRLGSYDIALEYLLRALILKRQFGQVYGLGTTLNNIGRVYSNLDDFVTARKYFHEALKVSINNSDANLILYSQNNIGLSYLEEHKIDSAELFFNQSIKTSKGVNNNNYQAVAYRGLGEVYTNKGQYDSAHYYYNTSLALRESISDKQGVSEILFLKAQLLNLSNSKNAAISLVQQSITIASAIGDRKQLMDNYQLLFEIYKSFDNYPKALEYQTLYVSLKDSLYKEDVVRSLALIPIKIQQEEQKNKIAEQQARLTQEQHTNNLLFILFVITIPFTGLLALLYRKNRITNRILREKNADIVSQKEEIETQKEVLTENNYELERIGEVIKNKNEELLESYKNISLLNEIGRDISKKIKVENIVKSVYANIRTLMPVGKFGIGILNEDADCLIFHSYSENSEEFTVKEYSLDEENHFLQYCIKNNKEVTSGDIKNEYGNFISDLKNYEEDGLLNSILLLPLVVNDEVIGNIGVQVNEFDAYTENHLNLLRNLSVNVGIAVQNANIFNELNRAYEQLKELDKYKETMTAMIVHDFKNSLNTVINFSETIPTKRRLKSIHQAGQFMLNLVLNILDVQKFESTKVDLALSSQSIKSVITNAHNQLSHLIEQKSIILNYDLPIEYYVHIDLDLCTRVFINILSNAIKYVPPHGKVDISVLKRDEFLEVSISDNGPGIASDKLDLVFNKYAQINPKTSGAVRSTGVGLTFCKMVVEAHGGTIFVRSTEGAGSTFIFTLPCVEQEYQVFQNKVPQQESNNSTEFTLNDSDREVLSPYIEKLSKWDVFDYSDVAAILNGIETNSGSVRQWKKEMEIALQNVDTKKYNELLKK